ncbi:MAG TPA: PP2C family serine/threonine-protein phosphatase [Methanospirillum sp.]|uniref:PP2C family serine/threonine-protein phosphatase n=1 Tax=Methanospirillum sp. TaxID=45200 RepID=UPI002CA47DDF|nr:PP2C family serine/threonine-protein phosphatase [Methanospirillum sp.]HWQ64105.1 PP2C family serine/threonine-protein phosphatase [Methanospirillum sp.]
MSIRISGSSVRGNRHIQSDQPCQDAYAAVCSENIWGIAVADGLGSARHSDAGARIAVDTASKVVIADFENPDIAVEERIRQAFLKAREAVIKEANEREINPSEFASTLIVAFYSDERITLGHIGDGIAVGTRKGQALLLSSPGDSEYANETASLTQSDWENQLRITPCFEIDHVIIATDGCQGALAIKRGGSYQPHEPFILPLLSFIEKKISANLNPESDITTLLSSRKMQELSGDDKTLVVIFREQIPKAES